MTGQEFKVFALPILIEHTLKAKKTSSGAKQMTKRFLQTLLMGLAILSLTSGVHASNKITVCHKDLNTISIDRNAWDAHYKHGDVWGSCDSYPKYSVVVIFRCGVSVNGGLTVTTVSPSVDIPVSAPQIAEDDNCADTNATLIEHGFNLKNVTSGSVDTNFETEYFYSRQYLQYHRPR